MASVSPAVKWEVGGNHLSGPWPDSQRLLSGHWGGEMTKDTIEVAVATLPWLHPHRLNLRKSRLLTRAAKGFLNKPLTKASESSPGSQNFDYVPLVSAPDPSHSTEGPSCEPLPVLLQKGKKA